MRGSKEAGLVRRALLVPLRVYLGVVFLVAVWPKLTVEGGFRPRLEGFARGVGLENAHDFYRPVLESLVIPNAGTFTTLVVFGELLVGVALVTGTATRLAAAAAMFMVLNYMLAKGAWFWTPSSNDAAFFFIALVLILGAAGRSWGIDGTLGSRMPAWLG